MQLAASEWNGIAIRRAHRDQRAALLPARREQTDTITVWRRDYNTYFRTLDRDDAWLWRALAGGISFGEACSEFAAAMGTDDAGAAQRAAGLLRGWVDEGWIQDYLTRTDD